LSFFKIADLGHGSLTIGPRPGRKILATWTDDLKSLGISHVVSLIEMREIERHGLQDELQQLAHHDIGFTHFPIGDLSLPDGGKFVSLISDLREMLAAGENLFVHCAGGVGRAGTTASCLLIQFGEDAEIAMQRVSKARGETVPETEEQIQFVRRWKRV